MLQQPLVEAAAGGEPALQAFGRQSATMLTGDEAAQLLGVQGDHIGALFRGPRRERGQIAAIGVQRMRGHAPLDLQMGEEFLDDTDRFAGTGIAPANNRPRLDFRLVLTVPAHRLPRLRPAQWIPAYAGMTRRDMLRQPHPHPMHSTVVIPAKAGIHWAFCLLASPARSRKHGFQLALK